MDSTLIVAVIPFLQGVDLERSNHFMFGCVSIAIANDLRWEFTGGRKIVEIICVSAQVLQVGIQFCRVYSPDRVGYPGQQGYPTILTGWLIDMAWGVTLQS